MENNKTVTISSNAVGQDPNKSSGKWDKKEKKLGHRRVTGAGEVTYKKKTTSELQKAIKLGIHVSVSITQQKTKRDLLLCDFGVIETVHFPHEGSKTTPAHNLSDYRFRTYAPAAFRYFREFFKVDVSDFLDSLCNKELRELTNPGASGSIFYITKDDEFIVKTVQHKEAEFLRELLPEYFMNVTQHPCTLLPKFYGLYCYQCNGKNIRFVVMNNLLPSSIRMHEMYDLKGSTYKRFASSKERAKTHPTLKDLDFRENHSGGILLEGETYDALIKTIDRDCRVLESFRIMDYSLLLGVHNLDQAKKEREDEHSNRPRRLISCEGGSMIGASGEKLPSTSGPIPPTAPPSHTPDSTENQTTAETNPSADCGDSDGGASGGQPLSRGSSRGKSVRRIAAYSTAMESIMASAEPVELESDEAEIPPGGIPSRNVRGERLLCYVGIIDILQSFRLMKKMEHTFKAIVHDADSISVHNPSFYAQRFQTFVTGDVFKKVPSPSAAVAMKQAPTKKKLKTRANTKEGDDKEKDENTDAAVTQDRKKSLDQQVSLETKPSESTM